MRLRTKVFCVSFRGRVGAFSVVGCCNTDNIAASRDGRNLKLASVINLCVRVTRKYGPLSKWKGNWITGHCHSLPSTSLFIFYSIFPHVIVSLYGSDDFYFGRSPGDLLIFLWESSPPHPHSMLPPMIFIKSMKGKVSSIDKNRENFLLFWAERWIKHMCLLVCMSGAHFSFTQYWFYCY